ncbi:MAG: hypothetical protein A2729_03610 [Candidatus Buchananbacteria bacterium RIFCSPHIGHO2_01_FULL_39_14]|uniref:Uncharacterized protein n=1 Tax=Candidatus Buchananbacteria bacterium RIFCSPHIGHO2_01_FULL_39_14 TaxID=1797532 RepID=A0A1G1XV01_9BACT|nr:MAG: hypothetical protein A2729_03610 [Candidatus Buchananbacteria bacterium RIFCSPHIGHO2_01_FULL_39_14]
MGILNHLFGSTEAIAREMELDDKAIVWHWKEYLRTISRKEEIIGRLKVDTNFQRNLGELKKLLEIELVDISVEEKKEVEIISDLKSMAHSVKIQRVHKLEQCLGYAETKYEYVYGLLKQLDVILKNQMQLVRMLQVKSKKTDELISHLKAQLELELIILEKIKKIETFHTLFLALVKGEHIIHRMDAAEKKLLAKMQSGMGKIFSQEITKGVLYEWAMTVFSGMEDKVHELVADGMLDQHPDMDFEFVNRGEFVDLVRECIQRLRKRKVSEQMITVFVHLFREWFNHERE